METHHAILLLICFHLLTFRRFYFQNPYVYATSEALEQAFPSWLALGRAYRAGHLLVDDSYYHDYHGLPFLSSFYPPHILTGILATWLPLDGAWILYSLTMVLHFYCCSVAVYILLTTIGMTTLTALWGAVTLSSLGYAMKQNSCIVYTLAWIPLYLLASSLHATWLSGISFGMMLLAGYWPLALYTIPLGILLWVR